MERTLPPRPWRHPAALMLALCVATPGCASYSLSDAPPPGFARLRFVGGEGKPLGAGSEGIRAVGATLLDPPGRDAVWVRPGKRSVGYACPGVIFMDWPPTVTYTFERDHHYELVCERGKATIRPRPVVARLDAAEMLAISACVPSLPPVE